MTSSLRFRVIKIRTMKENLRNSCFYHLHQQSTVEAPISGHPKRQTALTSGQIFPVPMPFSDQILIKNVPKAGQLQLADIKSNSRWCPVIRASTVFDRTTFFHSRFFRKIKSHNNIQYKSNFAQSALFSGPYKVAIYVIHIRNI